MKSLMPILYINTNLNFIEEFGLNYEKAVLVAFVYGVFYIVYKTLRFFIQNKCISIQ